MDPQIDFFDAHTNDWLILIGLTLFPRITLLFMGGPFSFLHWIGWLICPHVLVAILATLKYWDTNPALCVAAWFVAVAGTGGEGKAAHRSTRWRRRRKEDKA